MTIKITYTDSTTEEVLGEDLISDEEIKALGIDMISSNPKVVFSDWLRNAIHTKAGQVMNKICEDAFGDKTNTILSLGDKQMISDALNSQGIHILLSASALPNSIKRDIVVKANVKSAAERQAEWEAKLKAEEEARLKAKEEARLKAEEEARLKAEEEAKVDQ